MQLKIFFCRLQQFLVGFFFKIADSMMGTNNYEDGQKVFEQKFHKQMSELLRVRTGLRTDLTTKDEFNLMMTSNECAIIEDRSKALNRCADIVTFGALEKCQKCQKGEMMFTNRGYVCNGMINEWTKCGKLEVRPLRKPCVIPEAMKKKTFFAKAYEVQVKDRMLRPVQENRVQGQSIHSTSLNVSTPNPIVNIDLKKSHVVDRRSKLNGIAHVYQYKRTWFSSILGRIDIATNQNSYFLLQVLELDASNKEDGTLNYSFFTSWGRIGTNIGNSKTETFPSSKEACLEFKKVYLDQTGNNFDNHDAKRIPGKYHPIDISFKNDIKMNTKTPSKLNDENLKLMELIFDIQSMDKAVKMFNLDIGIMPLGKLSAKQLNKANETLNNLEVAINVPNNEQELIGLSEKFYTLVPHSFGVEKIPIINSHSKVKDKRKIVNSLSDIEHAYSIMILGNDGLLNSFDHYYNQLNASVTPMNKKSKEYSFIIKYIQNTSVHEYKLQVLEVFEVCRKGEKERFEKFKNTNNRMLLWHGSKVTNFASIISKGLTVGPVANGSMFGRGIYFADMVTKSANYCKTGKGETGLLVLSEVALGNIKEMTSSINNLCQAPSGFLSVKGVGKTVPDPADQYTHKDGVIIPYGQPKTSGRKDLTLNYNEYIVYDDAQVNIQYIVMAKFT